MNEVLAFIISLLVYPGLIFGLVAALIFGVIRGFARASANGAPALQPPIAPREVTRRLRQASTLPDGVYGPVMQAAPILAFICPLLVLVFVPLPANRGGQNMDYTADVVAAALLLLGMPLTRIALGWAIPSPYTRMAAMRSARQLMGYFVPLALAVATAIAVAGSLQLYGIATSQIDPNLSASATRLVNYARLLGGLAYLTCLPALARITPIRQGMGNLDLVGHELTELSGRELVVMRFAEALQLVAVIGFGLTLFVLPYFHTDSSRALASIIAALIAVIGLGVWEGLAPKFYTREESTPPTSVWFGIQTFLGVGAVLLLVLAQRF